MALPKDPRQKMINFMYLVLTAMLALNVSTEILNAFKVVDTSLKNSNGVIKTSNKTISESLVAQGKKPELADKVAIWEPKANEAIATTNAMSAYIDNLKEELKKEAGLVMKDGVEDFKEDDLDAATRLMVTRGEGKKLHDELEKFVAKVSSVIPDTLKKRLPNFPLDLKPIVSNNEASKGDWTYGYFHMTPTVAGLTMLSKFQNDVMRSGNIVANFCQEQIGKVEVVYDKFEILTSQSSNYVLPGQPIEIKAGVGVFSSAAKPTISIGGQSMTANDQGFAVKTINPTSSGSTSVTVTFKDQNGQTQTRTAPVEYTVGQPSGASIFLSKMNVMYIGVDNPITVSGGSGKAETMTVSFSGGSISGSGGNRICKPTTPGPASVTVTIEGKPTTFPIRVKYLPDPIAMVGNLTDARVSTAQFKAMGGVRAMLKDSDFDAPFSVLGYSIGSNCGGTPQEATVNGAQWGNNAVINSLKPGCVVYIENIRVQGPDGRPRKLPTLGYRLQ
ncbi:MAG: GldM family protein [Bacteroidota bacterium]